MSKVLQLAKLGLLAGAMIAGSAALAAKPSVTPAKSTLSAAKQDGGKNASTGKARTGGATTAMRFGRDKDRRGNGIGIGGGRPDRPGRPNAHPDHPDHPHPERPRSPK